MAFPQSLWDGTSPRRLDASVYATPSPDDWNELVRQVQEMQGMLFMLLPYTQYLRLILGWTNVSDTLYLQHQVDVVVIQGPSEGTG